MLATRRARRQVGEMGNVAPMKLPATPPPSAPATAVAPQRKSAEALRDQATQQAGTEQRPPEPSWESWLSDPLIFATLWLAFATTGLWIFTYRLWRATSTLAHDTRTSGEAQAEKMERAVANSARSAKSAEDALVIASRNADAAAKHVQVSEDTAQRQLRAYLSVTRAFAYGMNAETQPTFGVVMKNQGQTPAYHVRLFSRLNWTTEGPENAVVNFEEPADNIGTVAGGGERTYRSASAGHPWPPGLYDAVMSKQAVLVYSGVIVYRDAFRKRRLTTFMAYLNIDELVANQADLALVNRSNHSN